MHIVLFAYEYQLAHALSIVLVAKNKLATSTMKGQGAINFLLLHVDWANC